ncbi:MAG: hypothetical protein WC868_05495 [Bacteroidales bacterium]
MKKAVTVSILGAFILSTVLVSCKKDKDTTPIDQPTSGPVLSHSLSGLGNHQGYPSGTMFNLPNNVKIIGSIRGGLPYGKVANKSFKGPFPFTNNPKSWIDYGTGTYVNLYIKFYNTLPTNDSLTLPGGLIFCDSLDIDSSQYQKGFILQDVHIQLPALDTAFACIRAYCLNAHMMPSSYDAIYLLGPVTNNIDLNQIVTIMAPKQYPFGEEYPIQEIIWNVTDYGLNITPAEVSYLNSLP